jgi:hypothetical protein
MRPAVPTILLLLMGIPGCTAERDGANGRGSMTERERDSVIGASRLPGAGSVRGALGAADSAAARNAQMDSASYQP